MGHWLTTCGAQISPKATENRPNSRLLMQAALVAKDAGCFREFHYPAYRARWAEPVDIANPEIVHGLLANCRLDADVALVRAQSEELIERLDADSKEAMERGVFGAPTLFVGDDMFWGNDQFECVRHYIQKAQDEV